MERFGLTKAIGWLKLYTKKLNKKFNFTEEKDIVSFMVKKIWDIIFDVQLQSFEK